ncbi:MULTISPECIES: hypothetical protein [unclassified Knoellia]|uniref:hypothetical protein n=1 Tax=Knoellia altitudinis TaxID=3404795 RepID=UPI003618176B
MGQLTDLAIITTYLTVLVGVAGLLVVGLTAFVVLPALLESRTLRRSRRLSIPAFYFRTAASH